MLKRLKELARIIREYAPEKWLDMEREKTAMFMKVAAFFTEDQVEKI